MMDEHEIFGDAFDFNDIQEIIKVTVVEEMQKLVDEGRIMVGQRVTWEDMVELKHSITKLRSLIPDICDNEAKLEELQEFLRVENNADRKLEDCKIINK